MMLVLIWKSQVFFLWWNLEDGIDYCLLKINLVLFFILFIYLPQNTNNNKIKQNSNTKANKSGEEAQKKPWGL